MMKQVKRSLSTITITWKKKTCFLIRMLLRHDDNTSCESCQRRRTAPACTARTFLARPIFVPTQDGESEQRKSASQRCTHSERCKSKHRSKNNNKKRKKKRHTYAHSPIVLQMPERYVVLWDDPQKCSSSLFFAGISSFFLFFFFADAAYLFCLLAAVVFVMRSCINSSKRKSAFVVVVESELLMLICKHNHHFFFFWNETKTTLRTSAISTNTICWTRRHS